MLRAAGGDGLPGTGAAGKTADGRREAGRSARGMGGSRRAGGGERGGGGGGGVDGAGNDTDDANAKKKRKRLAAKVWKGAGRKRRKEIADDSEVKKPRKGKRGQAEEGLTCYWTCSQMNTRN